MRSTKPKKRPLLDEMEHELNRTQMLLNIWHEKTPAPLRRELRRRISFMGRVTSAVRKTVHRISESPRGRS